MTPERWQRIEELLHAILERPPADREAFLREACAGDEPLRAEVASLVAAHGRARNILDSPLSQIAADVLLTEMPGSLEGQTIGPYRVITWLGGGGMGDVYLAEDSRLGRRVALKLLPAPFAEDAERVRRFEQEARAASALNHPNVVTIHEIGRLRISITSPWSSSTARRWAR
jgi:serine/threonine protein kinase